MTTEAATAGELWEAIARQFGRSLHIRTLHRLGFFSPRRQGTPTCCLSPGR